MGCHEALCAASALRQQKYEHGKGRPKDEQVLDCGNVDVPQRASGTDTSKGLFPIHLQCVDVPRCVLKITHVSGVHCGYTREMLVTGLRVVPLVHRAD